MYLHINMHKYIKVHTTQYNRQRKKDILKKNKLKTVDEKLNEVL